MARRGDLAEAEANDRSGKDNDPMTRIVEISRQKIAAGTVLMKQGETGDRAWLILDGHLEVFVSKDGKSQSVDSAYGYEVVGEMALIDDGARTATVVALSDIVAIELSRGVFQGMLAECTPLAKYILRGLIAAIRNARGMPVAASEKKGPAIRSTKDTSRILERRTLAAGHVIFREGEDAETAYLIQSGEVEIQQSGQAITVLGPSRVFGELALVNNAPRSGTAMAKTAVTLEVIKRPEFEQALDSMPKILRALTRAYAKQVGSFG